MKKLKKILLVTAMTAAMAVLTTGCSLKQPNEAERAENVIEAYQTGDYEKFKSYIKEDERIGYFMDALDDTNADGMVEVYQKVYELTKTAEFTVTEIKDDNTDEYATVVIKTVDFTDALREAMEAAAMEGGDVYEDAPTWMMEALSTGGESVEIEVQVRTHSSGNLYDGFNDEFLAAITGGFYDYIPATMTTCTSTDGYNDKTYMFATYDEVRSSLDVFNLPFEGVEYTEDEINEIIDLYTSDYEGYDGLAVWAESDEDGLVLYMYTDYDVIDTWTLEQLDLITSGYGDTISLQTSISGYESDGYECETTDFGSGVLSEDAE